MSIVFGWLLLVVSLAHYSGSGLFKGVVGALAVYALSFGVLGQPYSFEYLQCTDDM